MRPADVVGLVGIGLAGSALAENLIAAGFRVVGYDIDPERRDRLAGLGGRAVGSAAEVAAAADRVVLSLMTSAVVREVVEGEGGLLEARPPPRVIVDTTTGDPRETEALAGRLAARGVGYVDATISGSSRQIARRQALFMAGGSARNLDACADVLRALAERFHHVGPSGSGARAKLASNLVLGLNRLALAEGLVLAERLGLDGRRFLDLLRESPAYSRVVVDTKGEKMLSSDFAPEARLAQHRKDVALILDQARALGQELPASRLHLDLLDELVAAGDGGLDCAAIVEAVRRRGRR